MGVWESSQALVERLSEAFCGRGGDLLIVIQGTPVDEEGPLLDAVVRSPAGSVQAAEERNGGLWLPLFRPVSWTALTSPTHEAKSSQNRTSRGSASCWSASLTHRASLGNGTHDSLSPSLCVSVHGHVCVMPICW